MTGVALRSLLKMIETYRMALSDKQYKNINIIEGLKGCANNRMAISRYFPEEGKNVRTYCPILKGYKTKLYEQHPELFDVFNEYRDLYFPNFKFDSVTINYMSVGSSMKTHFDKVNVGESVLVAFGNYNGGNTFIQNENNYNYIIYDARDEPLIFNGATRRHFVNTVSNGERFSLVFYNSKNKF